MKTVRIVKDKNYTVISNVVLRDSALSLKAKGLMCIILSLPDTWDFTISGLCAIVKESKNTVYTIINELEKAGYVAKEKIKDDKGRIVKHEYVFYESPLPKNPDVESPLPKNPYLENPDVENCTQLNTNNNKLLNKLNTNKTLSAKKNLLKNEYTPPHVSPSPPPSQEEVMAYFKGKIKSESDTPIRFWRIMTAQEWKHNGHVIYNWQLIADNWIDKEKQETPKTIKKYESIDKDQQRYERIARHINRYNQAVARRASGNSND